MTRMVLAAVLAGGLGAYASEVALETADVGGHTSFTDGANWSDSLAPSSGKDYSVGLGYGNYLLSPYNNLAKGTVYSWPGGALTLGDENRAGWLGINIYHANGATGEALYQKADWFSRVSVADLVVRNGGIKAMYGGYAGLVGKLTLASAHPAVIEVGGADDQGADAEANFYLGASLYGDDKQTLVITNTSSSKKAWVYVYGNNSNYKGRFVFAGSGFGFGFSCVQTINGNCFGGDPGYFMEDGLYFPDGFELWRGNENGKNSNANLAMTAANRGIKFKGTGTIGGYSSNTTTINVPISGEALVINQGIGKSYDYNSRVILNGQVKCDSITLSSSSLSRCIFGDDITDESMSPATINKNTFLGCRGRTLVKALVKDADAGFQCEANSLEVDMGHIVLTADSELPENFKILCKGTPAYGSKTEYPILSVPVSLRATLSAGDITMKTTANAGVSYPWEVRTADGFHTVYIKSGAVNPTAGGTTRFVVPAGTPGNTPTAPYDTWATAANDLATACGAVAGDGNILVAPGVYAFTSTAVLDKQNVTVRSCDPATGACDAENTIFDGGYPARTNRILKASGSPRIVGFTFRNAATTATGYLSQYAKGGGAICFSGDDSVIAGCVFTNCHAIGAFGGAIAHFSSNAAYKIRECRFYDCSANEGGAVGAENANADSAGIGCCNCIFERNHATAGAGGVFRGGSRPGYFKSCRFTDNYCSSAADLGAHVLFLGDWTSNNAKALDCVFEATRPLPTKAPLALIGGDNGCLERCTFLNISNNESRLNESHIVAMRGYARLVDCVITNCQVGSIAYTESNSADVTLRGCLIAGNDLGRLVSYHSAGYLIENCTIANNLFAKGSTQYSYAVRTSTFVNSIMYGNTWGDSSIFNSSTIPFAVTNSIIDVESVKKLVGDPVEVYSLANPGFKDAARGDYSLKDTAFARDKGVVLPYMGVTGGVDVDLAGNPRYVNDQGQAYAADALPDLGCYEVQVRFPPPQGTTVVFR